MSKYVQAELKHFNVKIHFTWNDRQGVKMLVSGPLPAIWVVNFRVAGHMTSGGVFQVEKVVPMSKVPYLNSREEIHLCQELSRVFEDQIGVQATLFKRTQLELSDPMGELPETILQMVPGR